MSELFSNERLIDYFALIDVEISNIDRTLNSDVFDKLSQSFFSEASPCLKIDYNYKIKTIYPKTPYNDFYTLNFETFFPLMPEERVYLTQRPSTSYSFIIPNNKGKCYYVFFYKVYLVVNKSNESISKIKEFNNGNIALYAPKYLCFISLHPFFVSFKRLLEELFINSTTKNPKFFKVENILNILLYRMFLPKYPCTQLNFCLGDHVYNFIYFKFRSEVGFRFFFSKISIENAVMLLVSMLLNSIIVIFHSDLEVIGPFIHLLTQLIYPISMTYSIVNNLTPDHLELLAFNGGLIAGIYKNDFSDLSSIMKENFTQIVYYDIDQNILMLDSNENLKEKKILPFEKMKTLINKLTQVLHSKIDNDLNSNNMVDCQIRNAFFEFIIDLFNGINLDKQIQVNEDQSGLKIDFDYECLIKDTILEYQPLLEVLQNSLCIKSFISTLKNYYIVNKKKINHINNTNKEANEDIVFFLNGLERKKKGKSTESLFMINILNTISISSPAYERLSYKQNNIFVDPFHEEIFKHSSAISYNQQINAVLNNYFIKAQKKDESKERQSTVLVPNITGAKQTKNQPQKLNRLATISNQLTFEFKEYLTYHIDSLKEFFGLIPNTFLLDALRSNHPHYQHQNSSSSSSVPSITMTQFKRSFTGPKPIITNSSVKSKEEYIESFNKVIKSISFKGEFHINFSSNVIESFCMCPQCNKPNNIWDIRKTFEYSKARRETRTICKYCSNSYVPYFKTVFPEEILSNKTKKTELVFTQKKNEYMSFEHIDILFSEGEISKKLPANLCNNINLIMGEIKCVIENNIKLYSIDSFIKENDHETTSKCNNKNSYLISQNSKEKESSNIPRSKNSFPKDTLFKKGR